MKIKLTVEVKAIFYSTEKTKKYKNRGNRDLLLNGMFSFENFDILF